MNTAHYKTFPETFDETFPVMYNGDDWFLTTHFAF